MRFVGIDPGASAIHCVVMDEARRIVEGRVLPADSPTQLPDIVAGATAIAIDVPAALSTAPHADDPAVSRKFSTARCCEIALGRQYRLWVPWVTPGSRCGRTRLDAGGVPGVRGTCRQRPHPDRGLSPAGFQLLASSRLPKKTTLGGIQERVARLEAQGITAPWMGLWSHDALDATLAALLALRATENTAVAVGCGHDNSAIWIPRPS
jgi:hypothetical protein